MFQHKDKTAKLPGKEKTTPLGKADVEALVEKYGTMTLGFTAYVASICLLSFILAALFATVLFTLALALTLRPLFLFGVIVSMTCFMFPICLVYCIVNWKKSKKMFKYEQKQLRVDEE